jgi:hypothetical protein
VEVGDTTGKNNKLSQCYMKVHRYKEIIIVFISLLLLGGVSCKDKPIVEQEPNNSFSSATEVRVHSKIKGYIDKSDDQDIYRLEVVEPVILDITLSAVKGVNHALKIYSTTNDKPLLIKVVDDLRKSSPERICNLFCQSGIYFISVLHGSKDIPRSNLETPYNLSLLRREPGDNEELEVNDSAEMARPIDFDTVYSGYFSPSYNRLNENRENPLREEDWYYIDINLDEKKPILVDVDLTGVPEINPMIYFIDSELYEISMSDTRGVGSGESLKGVGITTPGRYYVMITSRNFGSNNDIPYNLQILKKEYDYSIEMEPNNTPENASTIVDNQINGTISPEGDVDYFLYRVTENVSLYRIEVEPPPEINIRMRIYNAMLKKLYEIDNNKNDKGEIMPNAFIEGDFFIEVYSDQRVYDQEHPYSISVSSMPYSGDSEIELNDTISRATKIKGDAIVGYTSRKDDVDYYYLEYTTRVRCNFTIRGIKNSKLKISVTDPLGYIIKTVTLTGNQRKSFNEMIDLKGFLIVESVIESYDEPYSINIRVIP